jgi:hypothetical protein
MKKLVGALGVLILALAGPAAAAAAPPRAALHGFLCQTALDPPARAVSVQSVMRPLPGTKKLSVRFQLLMTRKSFAPVSLVRAGDLGTWISPADSALGQRPGDVWKLSKPVFNLLAPATYRFRVTFRWTGSTGHPLGTAVRLSPVCVQPELRPDLLVSAINVIPIVGAPGADGYRVVIRNAGATAAGPFQVVFAPGDSTTPRTRTVTRLDPHSTVRETFVGPLCTTLTAPTVTVDPADQVDDFNRSNNALTAACPAPSG